MSQLSFDALFDESRELIHCQLSSGFHWLRITNGHTPSKFIKRIHFTLDGYDNLYENTVGYEEIMKSFEGSVRVVEWNESVNLC
ncbi:hypothetical protein QT711_03460 [Sporosarcina saromensis]|uniref:Uncharacterized protein n=1 Tax=Sporosarcina saromensis TaxID=359365 RepID=A0ABU4G5I2_9BACL|nr:hypothetical protein [Sporosarcina saromensis]MDW0112228.1 hypothetical protein [Sporosarcina saromensis]